MRSSGRSNRRPKCARFGEGREAKTMYGRSVDDPSRPWIHIGGGIYTTDERIYLDTVEGMAAIGIVDSLSVPSILHLRGKDARVRSPQELLSAIKTVILAREGIRRSGRAGLPIINGISAASNAVSMIAAAAPQFGLRITDGFLVDFLSEMIVNYEALQKVAYFSSISANIGSTSTPLFGGYAGGAEGVAVLATCYLIMGSLDLPGQLPLQCAAAPEPPSLLDQTPPLGDRDVQPGQCPQHALPHGQSSLSGRGRREQNVSL